MWRLWHNKICNVKSMYMYQYIYNVIPITVFFMVLSEYSIRLSFGHTFEYHLICKQMYRYIPYIVSTTLTLYTTYMYLYSEQVRNNYLIQVLTWYMYANYNHKTYDKLFLVYIDPKLIIFYIKNTNKFELFSYRTVIILFVEYTVKPV